MLHLFTSYHQVILFFLNMCLLESLKSTSWQWLGKMPAQITWSNQSASTGRKYKPLFYVGSAEEEQEFKQQGFVMRHVEADKTSTRSATLHQSKQTKRTFCHGRHFPAADSTQWLHFQDITVDLRGFSFSRAGKVTEEFSWETCLPTNIRLTKSYGSLLTPRHSSPKEHWAPHLLWSPQT